MSQTEALELVFWERAQKMKGRERATYTIQKYDKVSCHKNSTFGTHKRQNFVGAWGHVFELALCLQALKMGEDRKVKTLK